VVGVARYVWLRDSADEAKIAFTVADEQQGRGLGTLMLEQLAAIAREHGIRRFVAMTLTTNAPMLKVFADAGYETHRSRDGGVVEVSFDIAPTEASVGFRSARTRCCSWRSPRSC